MFVFFKQKTAYDMRISDWSSDVCSSDLYPADPLATRDRLPILNPSLDTPRREAGDQAHRDLPTVGCNHEALLHRTGFLLQKCKQIGRASCRERVCQYV